MGLETGSMEIKRNSILICYWADVEVEAPVCSLPRHNSAFPASSSPSQWANQPWVGLEGTIFQRKPCNILKKKTNIHQFPKPALPQFEENNPHQAQVQVQSRPCNILKTNLDQVFKSGKPLGNGQAQPWVGHCQMKMIVTKQSRQTSARPLCSLSLRIVRTASAPIDNEDDVKFGDFWTDQKTLYAFPRPGQ